MTCGDRDQDIMVRWKELLDKLESRKSTLSGFNSLMAMFREIESIQEELKEVQVGALRHSEGVEGSTGRCGESVQKLNQVQIGAVSLFRRR